MRVSEECHQVRFCPCRANLLVNERESPKVGFDTEDHATNLMPKLLNHKSAVYTRQHG